MSNIRLFFAGDFCSKPSTKPISVSDELRELILSCDLKVINFEVPLRPENVWLPPQDRERFYQHDDVPNFLRELGFNLFQLANNHAFDWGVEGFMKTKAALGDQSFGAGNYEEVYCPKIVKVNGVKIGFLAVCFAAYKGVFDDVMNHDGLGCAYINDLRVNHDIIEAKKNVDYLFVLPHDGIEYIDVPLPETIARYRDFIDYGADGVIGTHPHCPQGWETYKGKPIFYSLGNFLFNSKAGYDYRATNRPHWYEGLCVVMTIENNILSCEVVNTKNVDNLGIEIDGEESRTEHNKRLCRYLINKQEYDDCFRQQVEKIVLFEDLPKLDTTFHDVTINQSVRAIIKFVIKKLLKKKNKTDCSVCRLLKHDTQRASLLRVLNNRKNEC